MIHKVVLHTFSNGSSIFEMSPEVTVDVVEAFREHMLSNPIKPGQALIFKGFDIEVVEHANPMGPVSDVYMPSFDALSHAFGHLGWEVEDEQIHGLMEGLNQFYEIDR